jgi:hypothetical protein
LLDATIDPRYDGTSSNNVGGLWESPSQDDGKELFDIATQQYTWGWTLVMAVAAVFAADRIDKPWRWKWMAMTLMLMLGVSLGSHDADEGQYGLAPRWRDDDIDCLLILFSGVDSEGSIAIQQYTGNIILTLADSTLLGSFENDLGFEHLILINGLLRKSPSQTWIGMVILDTRLDLALLIK